MINLFSLKYGKEVEKTEDLIYDSLTHGEVVFQMDKERKNLGLMMERVPNGYMSQGFYT